LNIVFYNHHQIKILEENHYYPFGLKHGAYNQIRKDVKYQELAASNKEVKQVVPEQVKFKYLYNGKELQDELGLNIYDYGARTYDPAVPRFWQIDPLAEKYSFQSVYVYADDNPVRFMDIDGKGTEDEWIIFSTGETVRVGDKGGDEKDYVHKVDKNGNITTKVVDVKKKYGQIPSEVPILLSSSPGLRTYMTHLVSPAIKENNIFFDILTGRSAFQGFKLALTQIPKEGRILGSASKTINYFTQLAKEQGYSTKIVGKNIKAGFFAQLYHNIYYSWKYKSLMWKTVTSNSEATAIGREMLNATLRNSVIKTFISLFSTVNDFESNE